MNEGLAGKSLQNLTDGTLVVAGDLSDRLEMDALWPENFVVLLQMPKLYRPNSFLLYLCSLSNLAMTGNRRKTEIRVQLVCETLKENLFYTKCGA